MRISRIRFGAANDDEGVTPNLNAWKDIGFDLDGMCTGSSTCSPGGTAALEQACKNPTLLPFDGNRCIDNAIGKLFTVAQKSPQVGLLFGVTEQNFNCALHRGELTTLIRITGYDGQPNDPSVRADLYTSVGVDPRWLPSWRCLGPDGKLSSDWFDQAPILPTRHFTVARHSLALNEADGSERADAAKPLPNAKVSDAAAFVRAGWLFVSLPPASEFWLDGERAHIPGFRLELSRSVLVARIGRGPDGTWSLTHGTAAGVVRPHDILQAFRNLGFCENMCLAYRNLIDYLNSERDMLLTATGPLPEVLCDSLSIGFAFEARQAAADSGDIVDVSDPVDCPKPRHPLAPQHGCTCPAPDAGGGACLLP